VRVEASDDRPGAAAGEAVGRLPGRTAAWLARSLERALAEEGLSLPQYRLLAFLSEGRRP